MAHFCCGVGHSLWHTWFDRDLGISGRVVVRTLDPETQKEKIEQRLVQFVKPLARVSTLSIHLQTAEERGAFKVNKEEHLSPVIGTSARPPMSLPTAPGSKVPQHTTLALVCQPPSQS